MRLAKFELAGILKRTGYELKIAQAGSAPLVLG